MWKFNDFNITTEATLKSMRKHSGKCHDRCHNKPINGAWRCECMLLDAWAKLKGRLCFILRYRLPYGHFNGLLIHAFLLMTVLMACKKATFNSIKQISPNNASVDRNIWSLFNVARGYRTNKSGSSQTLPPFCLLRYIGRRQWGGSVMLTLIC